MFPHPFLSRRYSDFSCIDESPTDPVTAVAAMICIIGLPFWLIHDFVKQIIQKSALSSREPT
jgi:hypothetical protein